MVAENAGDEKLLLRLHHWILMAFLVICTSKTPLEGGFRGRTNKLVDACYSYWQVSPLRTLLVSFALQHLRSVLLRCSFHCLSSDHLCGLGVKGCRLFPSGTY